MPTRPDVALKRGNARLLKLAAFLKRLPPKRFDYLNWVGDDWQGKPDLSCGTTACALGWACAMPEFKRSGMKLSLTHYQGVLANGTKDISHKYFHLTALEWDDIFMWGGPKNGKGATAKEVAAFIEQLVKGRS